jgi:Ser/Thr protein kinase RdoA (MazF antagonist)
MNTVVIRNKTVGEIHADLVKQGFKVLGVTESNGITYVDLDETVTEIKINDISMVVNSKVSEEKS